MESGSLPEIEEINFTSSDNKSPIVNCDPLLLFADCDA